MANTTGKKHGGREKGTPNKLTKDLRNILKDIIYNELELLNEKLDELESKERIELVIKLLPYSLILLIIVCKFSYIYLIRKLNL